MDRQRIIIFLLFLAGICQGQITVPDIVAPTGSNQIQFWNGTAWGLREVVGVTIDGTQIIVADNSTSNEGLLGVGAGTSTSALLLTNTTTGTGVTINANAPLTIAESTSSNGGSITLGVTEVDGSVTNEGQLSITGNPVINGATISSNTSGSTPIKVVGKDGIVARISATNDTLIISSSYIVSTITNHSALTVNNATLTNVGGTLIEEEEASSSDFTIYLHFTTGATSQGLQFRITNSGPGTYWYDYNFPITGDRITGSIYNANTTIVVPSSETGTNIAIIRGISKAESTGGIFELQLQVSAEDGSSTISILTTGITKR